MSDQKTLTLCEREKRAREQGYGEEKIMKCDEWGQGKDYYHHLKQNVGRTGDLVHQRAQAGVGGERGFL